MTDRPSSMGLIAASLQYVVDAHGVMISCMGMLIVFSGLILICTFIALLPRVMHLVQRRRVPARPVRATPAASSLEEQENILSAITYVVHSELAHLESDNQRVTLDLNEPAPSNWGFGHFMRNIWHRGSP